MCILYMYLVLWNVYSEINISYLTNPLQGKVAICNHQADSPLYMWPDVWYGDFARIEKSMVIHQMSFTQFWCWIFHGWKCTAWKLNEIYIGANQYKVTSMPFLQLLPTPSPKCPWMRKRSAGSWMRIRWLLRSCLKVSANLLPMLLSLRPSSERSYSSKVRCVD